MLIKRVIKVTGFVFVTDVRRKKKEWADGRYEGKGGELALLKRRGKRDWKGKDSQENTWEEDEEDKDGKGDESISEFDKKLEKAEEEWNGMAYEERK